MEAGTVLSVHTGNGSSQFQLRGSILVHTHIPTPISIFNRTAKSKTVFQTRFTPSSSSSSSPSSSSVYSYRGPKPKRDFLADWVSQNDDAARTFPIYIGSASIFAVLFNRAISGIAPVADVVRVFDLGVKHEFYVSLGEHVISCASSQSRADLLTLGLAVTNILTGLVWLSIRPKSVTLVNPQGVECKRLFTVLPDDALAELLWVWESISDVTCCQTLVIVYESICLLQFGFAAESSPGDGEAVSVDADKLMQGSVCQGVMKSGAQSYLANLSLYPGKSELPFLPSNTQAIILQPLGDKGIAIIGGDTIRGFTTSDQAWITFIGEKLDSTLAKHVKLLPLTSED